MVDSGILTVVTRDRTVEDSNGKKILKPKTAGEKKPLVLDLQFIDRIKIFFMIIM